LVSPHRTNRPWRGAVERQAEHVIPAYDPECYLCPGNVRASGERNPRYPGTFIFDNDFPALSKDPPQDDFDRDGLLLARSERGICRVISFSPRHDKSLPRMSLPDIAELVAVLAEETRRLNAIDYINAVQIFENRGAMMGASNPHPHCQVWATESLPNEIAKEILAQSDYFESKKSCLLCDYLALEEKAGERIVCENQDFVALVPFWAIWPFETLVLSKQHVGGLDELSAREVESLADIWRRLTIRYDNLFEVPFPYSMGFHQRPADGTQHPAFHFHAHFYPPLLRSANVRKFMVGFELLGSPQRDITPEAAAERLQSLSETHYLERAAQAG
jgi:UDPglucose--hexose-1-phosphate uridylyltransferase